MVARILRPSVLVRGRGSTGCAALARVFWPNTAGPIALARHSTAKMNRRLILLSLADPGECRTDYAANRALSLGTGSFFLVWPENKKLAASLKAGTNTRGCGP